MSEGKRIASPSPEEARVSKRTRNENEVSEEEREDHYNEGSSKMRINQSQDIDQDNRTITDYERQQAHDANDFGNEDQVSDKDQQDAVYSASKTSEVDQRQNQVKDKQSATSWKELDFASNDTNEADGMGDRIPQDIFDITSEDMNVD
jgi:hypothetical protein